MGSPRLSLHNAGSIRGMLRCDRDVAVLGERIFTRLGDFHGRYLSSVALLDCPPSRGRGRSTRRLDDSRNFLRPVLRRLLRSRPRGLAFPPGNRMASIPDLIQTIKPAHEGKFHVPQGSSYRWHRRGGRRCSSRRGSQRYVADYRRRDSRSCINLGVLAATETTQERTLRMLTPRALALMAGAALVAGAASLTHSGVAVIDDLRAQPATARPAEPLS